LAEVFDMRVAPLNVKNNGQVLEVTMHSRSIADFDLDRSWQEIRFPLLRGERANQTINSCGGFPVSRQRGVYSGP